MTDAVIIDHLNGMYVVGLFPLLLDNTCWLLALDFDDDCWQDDVVAFLESCDQFGVSALLERSRSGSGAHVWIFFAAAVPAHQARKLGDVLITHTKANRFNLPRAFMAHIPVTKADPYFTLSSLQWDSGRYIM